MGAINGMAGENYCDDGVNDRLQRRVDRKRSGVVCLMKAIIFKYHIYSNFHRVQKKKTTC